MVRLESSRSRGRKKKKQQAPAPRGVTSDGSPISVAAGTGSSETSRSSSCAGDAADPGACMARANPPRQQLRRGAVEVPRGCPFGRRVALVEEARPTKTNGAPPAESRGGAGTGPASRGLGSLVMAGLTVKFRRAKGPFETCTFGSDKRAVDYSFPSAAETVDRAMSQGLGSLFACQRPPARPAKPGCRPDPQSLTGQPAGSRCITSRRIEPWRSGRCGRCGRPVLDECLPRARERAYARRKLPPGRALCPSRLGLSSVCLLSVCAPSLAPAAAPEVGG